MKTDDNYTTFQRKTLTNWVKQLRKMKIQGDLKVYNRQGGNILAVYTDRDEIAYRAIELSPSEVISEIALEHVAERTKGCQCVICREYRAGADYETYEDYVGYINPHYLEELTIRHQFYWASERWIVCSGCDYSVHVSIPENQSPLCYLAARSFEHGAQIGFRAGQSFAHTNRVT